MGSICKKIFHRAKRDALHAFNGLIEMDGKLWTSAQATKYQSVPWSASLMKKSIFNGNSWHMSLAWLLLTEHHGAQTFLSPCGCVGRHCHILGQDLKERHLFLYKIGIKLLYISNKKWTMAKCLIIKFFIGSRGWIAFYAIGTLAKVHVQTALPGNHLSCFHLSF